MVPHAGWLARGALGPNCDDIGMGPQLGWNPPAPLYVARMLLAIRHVRRREVKCQRGMPMRPIPRSAGSVQLVLRNFPQKITDLAIRQRPGHVGLGDNPDQLVPVNDR